MQRDVFKLPQKFSAPAREKLIPDPWQLTMADCPILVTHLFVAGVGGH